MRYLDTMRVRPIIPGGRAGLLMLAAASIPLVLSKCKPAAKWLGEKMVEWGEQLRKDAESPESKPPSSKETIKKASDGDLLKSASPATKEEVKEEIAAAATKKPAPPKPKSATKKPTPTKAGTATNPKKTAAKPKSKLAPKKPS